MINRGISGWQWIFIIEAIPTLFFAFFTYYWLPDYPETAKCKLLITAFSFLLFPETTNY